MAVDDRENAIWDSNCWPCGCGRVGASTGQRKWKSLIGGKCERTKTDEKLHGKLIKLDFDLHYDGARVQEEPI